MERKIKVFGFVAALMLAALVTGCKTNVDTSEQAVTGVTLNASELVLEEGKSATLTATVSPADATNKKVMWSSNKTEIASVDVTGKVTAKSPTTFAANFSVDGTGGTLKAAVDGTEILSGDKVEKK